MALTLPHKPAILQGSLVLVNGASGFIASHIVAELLKLGYNVRGTVRSDEKVKSTSSMFKPFESTSAKYEAIIVENFAHNSAFTKAVTGCSAVIHTASNMSFSPNPHQVVPHTVAGATSVINAAISELSVKRFVYTPSSSAATIPKPGQKFSINKDT